MSEYYSNRKRRGRRERIGFYTAFAICLVAICMAVYSTYNTVTKTSLTLSQTPTQAQQVNEPVYGVTEKIPEPTIGEYTRSLQIAEEYEKPTVIADSEAPTEPSEDTTYGSALETMLSVDLSLKPPVKGGKILREYTEDSVYYKILNVWKPHTGVDFEGKLGDDVYSMTGGRVTEVRSDKLFGDTVEISVNNIVCSYSGIAGIKVKEGDVVDPGEVIGSVGVVPIESSDSDHIHVSVKANGTYVDPLSFIGNNE